MRIVERLRGRRRSDIAIQRKLLKVIVDDLVRKLEDVTSAPAFAGDPAHCRSCCSAEEKPIRQAARLCRASRGSKYRRWALPILRWRNLRTESRFKSLAGC